MNIAVIIGRFQPLHNGHTHLISKALDDNDMIIVVLGSSNRHRSVKNPFTVYERRSMILDWASNEKQVNEVNKLRFVESPDNLYKEWSWKSEIVRRVSDLVPEDEKSFIHLYGHEKDDSTYYLKQFPEWDFVSVDNFHEIDATGIRQTYFESNIVPKWPLPEPIQSFLINFRHKDAYKDLMEDWKFFEKEKALFDGYPFPETLNFMCSDAVVVCKGHLLLIKRKHAPGKNSWALPGGFKNANETFQDTAIRELKEETNLRIPEKVLTGSIKHNMMFDDPRRNLGINRVSMAYYIEVDVNKDGSFPELRPQSDAFEAKWVPLSKALAMNLFEDHLDIIKYFV